METTDKPEEKHENEPPGSGPYRPEQSIVRLTFWQTVLSVAGVIIAIAALYAALVESAAVRRQTAAAVWPFVQMSIEDYDTGAAARFVRVRWSSLSARPAGLCAGEQMALYRGGHL